MFKNEKNNNNNVIVKATKAQTKQIVIHVYKIK